MYYIDLKTIFVNHQIFFFNNLTKNDQKIPKLTNAFTECQFNQCVKMSNNLDNYSRSYNDLSANRAILFLPGFLQFINIFFIYF